MDQEFLPRYQDIALRLRSLQPGQWLSHLPGLQEVRNLSGLGFRVEGFEGLQFRV